MSKEMKTMSRFRITAGLAVLVALLTAAVWSPSANAEGFEILPGSFDLAIRGDDGKAYLQAGGHPDVTATWDLASRPNPADPEHGGIVPAGANMRHAEVDLPPGIVGNPTVIPTCEYPPFFASPFQNCSDDAQVGIAELELNFAGEMYDIVTPIYNLEPNPGQPAVFGFWAITVPVIVYPTLRSNGDYGLTMYSKNIDETLPVLHVSTKFWGVPASPVHDMERGGMNLFGGGCSDGTSK